MIPYKGFLIETYPEVVKTPNGFGDYIVSSTWRVRYINGASGREYIMPFAATERDAKVEIDKLTDPTGKATEREYLAGVIKSVKEEIIRRETDILDHQGLVVKLKEQLERLKAEYVIAGGLDEQQEV